jgi:hypothetical protein
VRPTTAAPRLITDTVSVATLLTRTLRPSPVTHNGSGPAPTGIDATSTTRPSDRSTKESSTPGHRWVTPHHADIEAGRSQMLDTDRRRTAEVRTEVTGSHARRPAAPPLPTPRWSSRPSTGSAVRAGSAKCGPAGPVLRARRAPAAGSPGGRAASSARPRRSSSTQPTVLAAPPPRRRPCRIVRALAWSRRTERSSGSRVRLPAAVNGIWLSVTTASCVSVPGLPVVCVLVVEGRAGRSGPGGGGCLPRPP